MTWPERLVTDRLVLRRPLASDAAALFEEYAQDHDVTRYLTWRPHTRLDEAQSFLARCGAGWEAKADLTWALTFPDADRLIGMIGLRPRGHMADIGYVLARAYWGQGLMPEAGRAILDAALGQLAVHRVWAVCDVENRASARVMEKIGMAHEGVLRRWIVHPNISALPRDVHCYARVRETGGAS